MPAVVNVAAIRVNPPVYVGCPTRVSITLDNTTGTEQPLLTSPDRSFEVCLESPDFLVEGGVYRQRVQVGEDDLHPMRRPRLTVTFDQVVFRNPGSAQVRAIADCSVPPEISNNQPTQASLTVQITGIGNIAWLWTEGVECGLEDSKAVTWNPAELCAGGNLWVRANVRNRGSADAPASQASLTLMYGSGATSATSTASVFTPPIPMGSGVSIMFKARVPNLPGGYLRAQVCADVTNAVTHCDQSHLCAWSRGFSIAASGVAPRVRLVVREASYGRLVPGSPLWIGWSISNDCSDLGDVTATVTCQGTIIYTSRPTHAPPQTRTGDAIILQPSSIPDSFYQIGPKTLDLQITGSGANPGPYTASYQVVVEGLHTLDVRWGWRVPRNTTAITTGIWKQARSMAGVLSNYSPAPLIPVLITLDERDMSTNPPSLRTIIAPPIASLPAAPSPTSSPSVTSVRWDGIINDWAWLTPGVWITYGPLDKRFRYTVTYELADPYGNVYPPRTLDPAESVSVQVYISTYKTLAAATASILLSVAYGYVAAAWAALASGVGAGLAPGLFLAAAEFEALAFGYGRLALDPPMPDFDYHERVAVAPIALPTALVTSQELAPTRSVLELLGRILAAGEVLGRIHGKLIAARIDNNAEALRLQTAAYRDAERLLQAAAAALPDAAAEAVRALESDAVLAPLFEPLGLEGVLQSWRRDGLAATVGDQWTAVGLPADALERLDAAFRENPVQLDAVRSLLERLSQALGSYAREVQARTTAALTGTEEPTQGR